LSEECAISEELQHILDTKTVSRHQTLARREEWWERVADRREKELA
jgi:hypothetical protein